MNFSQITTIELIKYILIGIFSFAILYCIVFLLYRLCKSKIPSFAEKMNEKKSIRLSLVIDMNRKIVETYYVYETNNKSKTVNYDEFTYSLDSENLKILTDWLDFIKKNSEYGNYRRIDLSMYDDDGNKRLYRCSLQNYIKESNKYFIMAKDITITSQMIKDYEKKLSYYDIESFYEKVQKLLNLTLDNEVACIMTMRYKEYEAINKDFKGDFIKLIDYEVLNRLEAILEDDMAICQSSDATFHVFIGKVISLPKMKQRLRKILQTCSGNIVVGKGNFNINFCAGVMIANQEVPIDSLEKSEIALTQCLKKRFFADKILFFDKELSLIEKENVEQLGIVKKVIDDGNFELLFHPMISVESKKCIGYKVDIVFQKELEISKDKFIELAQEIGERKKYFVSILKKILEQNVELPIFMIIQHAQVSRFCDAYCSEENFKKIDLRLMVSFDTLTISEASLVMMEKTLKGISESTSIQFGIAINHFQTPYLNEIIYTKLEYMMIDEQVIDTSFDSTHFQIAFLTNQQIAKQYQLQLIGIGLNNIYQYEKMYSMDVKFVSGPMFNGKIDDDLMVEQNFIKQLVELEKKKYK